MKKIFTTLLLITLPLLLVSCLNESNKENDNIKPIVRVSNEYKTVLLNQYENVDLEEILLEGVTAIDNLDGDITEKIKVNYDEVDINIPGNYKAYFTVVDSSNNMSEAADKNVIVRAVGEILKPYDIYTNSISGEVKPEKQQLFGGAYYHKVQSSRDKWIGLEGTITLPEVKITRYDGNFDTSLNLDPYVKNLDNPSIYMGGTGSYESDVGLSLSRTLLKGTDHPPIGSYAFRPFWRYITNPNSVNKDIGGYDLANGRRYSVSAGNANASNMAGNWHYEDTEFYYLPGDKIRMIVYSPERNRLQLQIEVISKSTNPTSVKIREENGWKDPANFISPMFESEGHGLNGNAVFKRVNAIDQSGNEGKTAIPTNTTVLNANWESVYLHRQIDGKMYRIPFNEDRASSLSAPEANFFSTSPIDKITGGQLVSIHPNNG